MFFPYRIVHHCSSDTVGTFWGMLSLTAVVLAGGSAVLLHGGSTPLVQRKSGNHHGLLPTLNFLPRQGQG